MVRVPVPPVEQRRLALAQLIELTLYKASFSKNALGWSAAGWLAVGYYYYYYYYSLTTH